MPYRSIWEKSERKTFAFNSLDFPQLLQPPEISSVKIIAEAEACHDALRELAYLLAQTGYVDIYGAVKHKHVLWPDAVNQLLAREHAPLLVEKQVEDFKFSLRKRHVLAVEAYRLLVKVRLKPLVTQHVGLLFAVLLGCAAQHGAYPHQHFPYRERL